MHARVSTMQVDAGRIDDIVKQLQEEDLAKIKESEGFKGFTLFADRSSGKVIGASYWDSEENMKASEEIGQSTRQRAADTGGAGDVQVERYEVAMDTFMG
jgi:heme-degrading monooxygenase HmoA